MTATLRTYAPNGNLSQWILDQFEPGYAGHAVDVGASDGISINSTWALEKRHRWTVLSVEPNPVFHPRLMAERAMVAKCACDAAPGRASLHVNEDNPEAFSALRVAAHKEVREGAGHQWSKVDVPVETVDNLLARWEFPKLDALCVDTEGTEIDVLKGCDLSRWKPRVVVVEAWDAGACDSYLAKAGYVRRARNVHNDCYARADA